MAVGSTLDDIAPMCPANGGGAMTELLWKEAVVTSAVAFVMADRGLATSKDWYDIWVELRTALYIAVDEYVKEYVQERK